MTTAAVILAAGAGTRWHGAGHKLDANLDGHTIIELAISHAAQADLDETIVVEGALSISVPGGVSIVHNPDWASGQGSSLAAGVTYARHQGHDSIVVGLGDQPFLTPEAWRSVADRQAGPIVIATYGGRRAHPVRLDAAVWPYLDTSGDAGAASLVRRFPGLVHELPCLGDPSDIDTVGDLRRWSS
jgi:molybdenum cofactor cytidylyltransferase